MVSSVCVCMYVCVMRERESDVLVVVLNGVCCWINSYNRDDSDGEMILVEILVRWL